MHAEAIAIITELERRLDTRALKYGGVCYWPLIRQKVWGALMEKMALNPKGTMSATDAVKNNTNAVWPEVGAVDVGAVGPPFLGFVHPDGDAADRAVAAGGVAPKAVFFARPEEYMDTINGTRFAKTIDSVLERAATRCPVSKIEIADPRTIQFPRHYPSLFLHLSKASRGVVFDPPHVLENFGAIGAALKAINVDIKLNEPSLTDDMGKVFYLSRIFGNTLKQLQPKVFLQSIYYHLIGMAWVLACRRRNILAVDVQHGRLGPHEGHYTQLTVAPPEGYEIVPDLVWCWGKQTKHDIDVNKNPACQRHGGIVGGNMWLHKWRYGDPAALDPPGAKEFIASLAGRVKILVSLQPYDSPILPELAQAMRGSPPNWSWLMRVHPLRRHTIPEIVEILERKGITNAEVAMSSDLPLFTLLRSTDHHVTAFSSVTVEAAAFDVRTSLLGGEGVDAFAPQIARDICRYTPTAASILQHINEVARAPRVPVNDDFIDMTPGIGDRTLDYLLSGEAHAPQPA